MTRVLDVLVALALLGLTFGTMFIVTIFGRRPPHPTDLPANECFVCESEPRDTVVSGYPLCDACRTKVFPEQ